MPRPQGDRILTRQPPADPNKPQSARGGSGSVLMRNIRMLRRRRAQEEATASGKERLANAVTRFTGSVASVYFHLLGYGLWILLDAGIIPGIPRFDPSFAMLAMVASVEAIFLTTFVLITQNRMAAEADKRAELDLQISLLAEHEITKLIELVAAIADRMEVKTAADAEIQELKQDVLPEMVLDEIEEENSEKR